MKIELTKPFEVPVDRFSLENKKDEINPYMTGKLLRKRYEGLGYKVIQCADFETSLMVEVVRKYFVLDKYIKVKLGEYKNNKKTDEYNKEILGIIKMEDVEKLLFLCRVCSYLGDPNFPDFIIFKDGKASLRYVYTGDELMSGKLFFIFLARCLLEIEIKFATLDFSDHKNSNSINTDFISVLKSSLEKLSKRINVEDSSGDVGADLSFLNKWLEEKSADKEAINRSFDQLVSKFSENTKLKENFSKLKSINFTETENKTKPEKLALLREKLGVNMMEANELLTLKEIVG